MSVSASKARGPRGAYRLRTEARKVHPVIAALTAERQRQDLSQTELAARMGLASAQSIYAWEAGINDPKLSTLDRWHEALGMRLLSGKG